MVKRVLHFLVWRRLGIVWSNPVFENTYVFFYAWLSAGTAFRDVVVELVLFLLLNFAMASYGYLLNDAVDCRRDVRHGTDNPFHGSSAAETSAVILIALAANVPFVVYFAGVKPSFLPTWTAWLICATAYSLPGVYLKGRGMIGLVAVALALRTLPVLLVFECFGGLPNLNWAVILAYVTLRGIGSDLGHQITDFDEDASDGIMTFAQRLGPDRAHRRLDVLLQVERLMLVVAVGWILWTLPAELRVGPWVAAGNVAVFVLTIVLVTYALFQSIRDTRGINPHQPDYRFKDVFYLLHKTFPKIVLSLYLLVLLLTRDVEYLWILLPLSFYFRLFSPARVSAALRLKPREGGPSGI